MTCNTNPIVPETHFARFGRWLEMESQAERERLEERRQVQSSQRAEQGGETLLGMAIRDHTVGLGGRYLLTLQKRRHGERLPWNRFKVGSPVDLVPEGDGRSLPGIVSKKRPDRLQVAVDDWPDGKLFRIDLSPDEVTRRRQVAAMDLAQQATGRLAQLRDLLLYRRDPSFRDIVEIPHSGRLNESQQAALQWVMAAEDLAVIHGPPGTGKTTTLVEVIRQSIARGERVLACAPSNTAVDNLLERLAMADLNAVRLGHPARVLEAVRDRTLDALVEAHESHRIISEMLWEADDLERRSGKFVRRRGERGRKSRQRSGARELRRHARLMEKKAIEDVINDADVICATVSFDFGLLGDREFDLLVIDEACQSVEPGCWVPLRFANRVVLAGDHCQLPPTILSQPAARDGFAVSLMQRLIEHYGERVTRRLAIQYRMHQTIMEFSSACFYDDALVAHPSVKHHTLADLIGPASDLEIDPVTFYDTAGAGWDEEQEPEGLSRRNPAEGKFVLEQVGYLCDAGIRPQDIAVIAPYAAQVRWLRDQSPWDDLEIDTVDGFQGREKEAVVISTVRSNKDQEIGFLADERRMNVALTRAKRRLIVIGDSATLAANQFFAELLDWFESVGSYRTVWDEMHHGDRDGTASNDP
ncbi:MAG: AAA domain-containing protein [Planctomycetota bacterium]|nr:AAA domain-containing protein [Planctomycetota bacterium]